MSSEPDIAGDASHQVVTADVASAERTHTLKQDDCCGSFNEIGDIDAEARTEAGLYRAGVRHLSRFTLTVAGQRPLPVASNRQSLRRQARERFGKYPRRAKLIRALRQFLAVDGEVVKDGNHEFVQGRIGIRLADRLHNYGAGFRAE